MRMGHYYCFVKNSNGMWHEMNDSFVCDLNHSHSRILTHSLAYTHTETPSRVGPGVEAACVCAVLC